MTKEIKHTAGPWKYTYNVSYGQYSICHTAWCERGETNKIAQILTSMNNQEDEANAQLMAAAPELLEANKLQNEQLKAAWSFIRKQREAIQTALIEGETLPSGIKMFDIDLIDDMMLAFRAGDRAREKAKGE